MLRAAFLAGLLGVTAVRFDPGGYRLAGVVLVLLAASVLSWKAWRTQRRRALRRTIDGLRLLHPDDFEAEVARWLRREGWRVERRGGSGDGGIDLLARKGRDTLAVQCKRYAETAAVSAAQVRDLYGAAIASGSTHAMLVTTGRVSRAAVAWCEALPPGLTVSLLDAEAVGQVAAGRARALSS